MIADITFSQACWNALLASFAILTIISWVVGVFGAPIGASLLSYKKHWTIKAALFVAVLLVWFLDITWIIYSSERINNLGERMYPYRIQKVENN